MKYIGFNSYLTIPQSFISNNIQLLKALRFSFKLQILPRKIILNSNSMHRTVFIQIYSAIRSLAKSIVCSRPIKYSTHGNAIAGLRLFGSASRLSLPPEK